MSEAAPGGTEVETHPPVVHHPRPPGRPLTRPTVRLTPTITALLWRGHPGFSLDSRYVRRYWTAAIGPTAMCDLLRLARAGAASRQIPLPLRTATLLALGLAHRDGAGRIAVADRLPAVPPHLMSRYPQALRREHDRFLASGEEGPRPPVMSGP